MNVDYFSIHQLIDKWTKCFSNKVNEIPVKFKVHHHIEGKNP